MVKGETRKKKEVEVMAKKHGQGLMVQDRYCDNKIDS